MTEELPEYTPEPEDENPKEFKKLMRKAIRDRVKRRRKRAGLNPNQRQELEPTRVDGKLVYPNAYHRNQRKKRMEKAKQEENNQ